ncbi:MAG: methyltransferase [Gammaproteobacteria bacterium]
MLGLYRDYAFLPVIVLGVLYAALYFIRQCRHGSDYFIDGKISINILIRRAIARYMVWLVVLYAGYQFYLLFPIYNTVQHHPTHRLFESFLHWYLWLGIPYFVLTLTFKASRREDFYDPAVRMIHIVKQIILRALRGDNRASVFYVLRNRYNRKIFLNWVMRAYFIPVMVEQIAPTTINSLDSLYRELNGHDYMALMLMLIAILLLAEILNVAVAYCLESRWLENRSRSIDLTVGGWLVCVSCYPPLNELTTTAFVFAPHLSDSSTEALLFSNEIFFYSAKTLEALLLGVLVYIELTLGTSMANITFKKLQTRGPYSLVRHPGTTFKLLFWLAQSFIYKKFWTVKYLFGFVMWGSIYILRALSEERHLSKFREYQAYRKKVKKRFIPGIF